MSVQALFWAIEDVEGITSTEKLVLIGLANYADDQAVAHPALYTLERITGFTERGIRKTLRGLEEKGVIATVQRPGFTSAYRLALPTERLGSKRQPGRNIVPPFPPRGESTPEQTPERTPEQTPERGSPEPLSSIPLPDNHDAAAPPPAAKPGREKVGPHLLPADWTPCAQGVEYARRKGVDPNRELVALRNWADRKKAKKADWTRTWQNWCDTAADRIAERSGRTAPAVLWKDCAPEARPKGEDPRVMARLRRLTELHSDERVKVPALPEWLGTPAARTVPVARKLADLDAWLAAAVERNGLKLPPLPDEQLPLAAE